jgi:alpha-D-xyloside xylohydrolase
MLFDQEANKLQETFSRLPALTFAGMRGETALLAAADFTLEVSAPTQDTLRLRVERSPSPDYGILTSLPAPVSLNATVSPDGDIHIQTDAPDGWQLIFRQNPARLEVYRQEKIILQSATDRTISGGLRLSPLAENPQQWLLSFALHSEEAIFGLGDKFSSLNRRGQKVENWNRDATGVNAEISYKNIPFAWSPRGWGIFAHTPARVTHGVGYAPWSHRSYILQIDDPNLDLFLLFADTPAEMLARYTSLTGCTALPPRWSYGAWMSRAFYQTAEELLDVANQLRERQIPCDVLTLDGRAWHESETRFDFSWDAKRYPDPAAFVQTLRGMDYRLCLWEYSYLSTLNPLFEELAAKKFFLQTTQGETYIHRWLPPPNDRAIPHLQPSGLLDFTNPQAYAWFRDMHRPLLEMGVSVMKTDYGEAVPEEVQGFNGDTGKRLHNIYTLLYNRCSFEGAQTYGEQEGIVWGRSSWAGGQRYPVQWGGDPQGDWEGLAASIRGGLSWGMSGGATYAHDIGGFYGAQTGGGLLGGGMPEPELYIRWAQAGVMASHTRFHGTSPREPWHFGSEAEEIVRQWLAWRYRLIPYLQACALQAQQTGLPFMRAMPLAFPQEPLCWQFEHQYMLGDSLLVVPVLQPGGETRFYLPAGNWYDLWNETWVEGGTLQERQIPLEHIPVFGREGTILPLGPACQHTGQLNPGLDLQEVWAFGKPANGITLPGLEISVQGGEISPLPPSVRLVEK